jgi:hypothetical protein
MRVELSHAQKDVMEREWSGGVMRRTGDREREAGWVVIEGEDGLRKEKGVAEKGGLG